jgi:hypothetical protein
MILMIIIIYDVSIYINESFLYLIVSFFVLFRYKYIFLVSYL